ncbi:MAG TPA: hypothetical protein PLL15_06130 [Syntrophales bacterium]|nr:hypothetical protein [Syntrophales bacterium]
MAERSLTGDWDSLKRVLDQASPKIRSESRKRIGRQLKKIEARVLKHIDSQDLNWAKLSDPYARRKEKLGLSPDTLRASNQMYQNITTHVENAYEGAVGVKRGVKTKDGAEVTDIALIHEQPDDDGEKIPARKLWQPTFDEVKEEVAAELKGIAIEVFKK